MKIAFLNLYSGFNHRGAENFAHGLAERLARSHRIYVFSGGDLDIKGVQIKTVNTKVVQPKQGFCGGALDKFLKRLFLDGAAIAGLIFSVKLLPELWRGRFDWLIPLNGFWEVLICKLVVFLRGGRILITGHSGPGWDERWNLYLKPDVFVATTPSSWEWARQACPYTRVEMVPYGIDVQKYANSKPVDIQLARPIILCPAAAVPYKRVDTAIKALAALGYGSLLHLGDGTLKENIVRLGRNLLGPKRFASLVVSHSLMPSYYKACDLVTLPSMAQENSPMVFLEAMAAGKVVVATDAPRPRWMLGEAGVFVDPQDSDQYARAIKEALGRRDRNVIHKQVEKFSWEKVVAGYESLFDFRRR